MQEKWEQASIFTIRKYCNYYSEIEYSTKPAGPDCWYDTIASLKLKIWDFDLNWHLRFLSAQIWLDTPQKKNVN